MTCNLTAISSFSWSSQMQHDMMTWFSSPEVIEFNKWRGFGHISMDQKGTVPGASRIKVFPNPLGGWFVRAWFGWTFDCLEAVHFVEKYTFGSSTRVQQELWIFYNLQTWEPSRDQLGSTRSGSFSVKWVPCGSSILSCKLYLIYSI